MLYLLPQAVDQAAERDPDHEAVRCAGGSLTYGELADRSTQLANVLYDQGVRRGDRVAIHANKGLRAAIAMYGVMKAGAAYVPLDPSAPPQRLETIMRDCDIRHVVAEPSKTRIIVELVEGGVAVEGVVGVETAPGRDFPSVSWEDIAAAPTSSVSVGTMEQDLAYVLYTSGSTGAPKGVMHTHRSALSWAEVAAKTYGFRSDDRLSNHAPLHFDLSTLDYFATAVAGATTVVMPEAHTRFPASLSTLIQDERLTVLYAVPLALTHLLLRGALDQRDLSSVRWVLFGGEPIPTKHLRALMQMMPEARFSNVYGPTEVNGITYWPVPSLPEDSDAAIPIGLAFANVELLIVDEDDEPVNANEVGELLARTPTMMKGYWGRPDLDARAFWKRPASGGYDDVFHRTGDLVRVRSDGLLEFLGRKDRQVKVRGYRIELDEIEAVLSAHESVESAAVFVVPTPEGSQSIASAVTLAGGEDLEPKELLEYAARKLPAYALPEQLDVLESLPKTSTGKIDRLALRDRVTAVRS